MWLVVVSFLVQIWRAKAVCVCVMSRDPWMGWRVFLRQTTEDTHTLAAVLSGYRRFYEKKSLSLSLSLSLSQRELRIRYLVYIKPL